MNDPSNDPKLLPESIGNYRIIGELGRGGMGVVYEAEQENPRRHVALKVLRADLLMPAAERRFLNEAELLGRMNHPGIARIFEAGVFEGAQGNQPFFVMELVRGRPLIERANELELPPKERIELFVEICDAVQHAHESGVVHRDLKPGNILIDEGPRAKVLDFGVARATDVDMRRTTVQTEVGELIGTLPYMAPEQARGAPSEVGPATDVYALGVTLFELLTGRLPYELQGRSIPDAIHTICEEEPTTLGNAGSSVRGDLQNVVAKALEKETSRRYANAGELAADLRRYLSDAPVLARRATSWYRLVKFSRRNRGLAAGLAFAFLALTVGLIVSSWSAFGWARASERAQRKATEAESVLEYLLVDMIEAVAPERNGWNARVVDVLHQAEAGLEERFEDNPTTGAFVRHALGGGFHKLGLNEFALEQLDEALEFQVEEFGELSPEVLDTRELRGEVLTSLQRFDEALEEFRQVVEKGEQVREVDDEKHYRARTALGITLALSGQTDAAVEQIQSTLEAARVELGPRHSRTLYVLDNMARVLLYMTPRLNEAQELAQEAHRLQVEELGPGHPYTLRSFTLVIEAAQCAEEGTLAIKLVEELLAACHERYGPDHPSMADALMIAGSLERDFGSKGTAESNIREALRIYRERFGRDQGRTLEASALLADILSRGSTSLEDAVTIASETLEIARAIHPGGYSQAQAAHMLARIYFQRHRFENAIEPGEEALRIYRNLNPEGSTDTVDVLVTLGMALRDSGDYERAIPLLEEALDLERKTESTAPHYESANHVAFAMGLLFSGQLEAGQQELEQALELRRTSLENLRVLTDERVEEIEICLAIVTDLVAGAELEFVAIEFAEALRGLGFRFEADGVLVHVMNRNSGDDAKEFAAALAERFESTGPQELANHYRDLAD